MFIGSKQWLSSFIEAKVTEVITRMSESFLRQMARKIELGSGKTYLLVLPERMPDKDVAALAMSMKQHGGVQIHIIHSDNVKLLEF